MNMVSCACGNTMEVLPGELNLDQRDDMGKKITYEAALDMSKYRIRCYECTKIFCSNCKAEPYHVGSTCAQH